jgi:hypothetical protein
MGMTVKFHSAQPYPRRRNKIDEKIVEAGRRDNNDASIASSENEKFQYRFFKTEKKFMHSLIRERNASTRA